MSYSRQLVGIIIICRLCQLKLNITKLAIDSRYEELGVMRYSWHKQGLRTSICSNKYFYTSSDEIILDVNTKQKKKRVNVKTAGSKTRPHRPIKWCNNIKISYYFAIRLLPSNAIYSFDQLGQHNKFFFRLVEGKNRKK